MSSTFSVEVGDLTEIFVFDSFLNLIKALTNVVAIITKIVMRKYCFTIIVIIVVRRET